MRCLGAALALATALLIAGMPSHADAQSRKKRSSAKPPAIAKVEWRFLRATAPTLVYGIGADDFQISFSCLPDSGLLRIVSQIGSRGLQPGDGAAIRLANGKNRFEVSGTAFSTETRKDVDVGGATRMDTELFTLFKGGETLIVEVPGRKRTLPIQDAGPSADAFQKACSAMANTANQRTG